MLSLHAFSENADLYLSAEKIGLYLNGVKHECTYLPSAVPISCCDYVYIMLNHPHGCNALDVADVALWNRTLMEEEILALRVRPFWPFTRKSCNLGMLRRYEQIPYKQANIPVNIISIWWYNLHTVPPP